MKHLYEVDRGGRWRGLVWSIVLFVLLAGAFLAGVRDTVRTTDQREARLLGDALRRAAVTCYAVEGRYPPSLDYMTENYGVVIDAKRYIVRYDAFSENLMPSITVLKREGMS